MELVSYQIALEKILQKVPHSRKEQILLGESLHHILAEDMAAPLDIPVFDNSAMDGFGFSIENLRSEVFYPVVGEIKAGADTLPSLIRGQAVKVLTGAPVPPEIEVIIPIEDCIMEGNEVKIISEHWEKGKNIRQKGTQTQKGEIIVEKNTKMTPGIIGMLATFGITDVYVYSRPKTGILITGDELAKAGDPLKPGQIYESNSLSLKALLNSQHIEPMFIRWIPDNLELTVSYVEKALLEVDMLLITGGISESDYDLTGKALQATGVDRIFYKVKQKPGKPLYFGSKGEKVVFGLPGNPAAVFICFHVYVTPFINAFTSENEHFTDFKIGKISHEFRKKSGLTQWLKAVETNGNIQILTGQESYKMNAFIEANCLACIDAAVENLENGSDITYLKL